MKTKNITSIVLLVAMLMGCDILDTKIDTMQTQDNIDSDYNKLQNLGYTPYSFITHGFAAMDNNLSAAMSDEAVYTQSNAEVRRFNQGTWSQYNNPDDVYKNCYKGIRAANYFLDYSVNYKQQLAHNRDTISDGGYAYRLSVRNIEWMRAESHVLRAYFYFELTKRYGGVPLIERVISAEENPKIPRADFDQIVTYAVGEIDAVLDDLQPDWKTFDSERDGRFTKGAAMALKSRILLYAASPRNNPTNGRAKWEKAAEAAHDVIALGKYALHADYRNLFLESNSATNLETIMAYRCGAGNSMEKRNYPVATPGGNSGVTPTHDLVAAYEYKGTPDLTNPYANRDPRLAHTVVLNNSTWNGRIMEIYTGGKDAPSNINASRTGYYLKKFLLDNLYLSQDETRIRNWIMFRYAEILLNYAEAMNEAYGPDGDNGYGRSARQAVNEVRNRAGVKMAEVAAEGQVEMRERIKHERRIELAFEGHRFWDLIRWEDAEDYLNGTLRGVAIKRVGNTFDYSDFVVEKRVFEASKMYYYPIPYTEIVKSDNVLIQNKNW